MKIAKTQIAKMMTRKDLLEETVIGHGHAIGAETVAETEITTDAIVAETETAGGTGVAIDAGGAATAAAHRL
jgi:hypothetical protein